ncbi:MAG: S9 family peptidase [Bacteroidales bacterium]|jgi:dipeptidyl aminopeptidase/acylaminoacyl peptidase|nr:S9 family peptidase [Bacteroidales bacterium]NLM92862.1 S9 family peptidase [Bacteroidales bacterium]
MKRLFLLASLVLAISIALPAQRKAMIPENLWELNRISDVQISPDGTQVLYGVTSYDIETNRGSRDLFVVAVEGGQPRSLTRTEASEANGVWRPDGRKIGFIREGQLWEMEPDGSNQVKLTEIAGGITGFGYAPDMKHIFFTKEVKMMPTVHDLHPDLPQADALVYDDLMYRHWNGWSDENYSHIFVAPYMDGMIGRHWDIMEGQPYDSPVAPFGGNEQIAWTHDGKALAYTCKKLEGKEWAVSTNTDIYLYELAGGQTKNLTEFNPGYDKNPVFSPDGRYMAWESMERPGFEADKNRILVMDFQTGNWRDYSEGFDQSSDHLVWSADSRRLYFLSGVNATYQLYSLDMGNGRIDQITTGMHDYQSVALAGNYLVAQRMSMSMPTEIYRVEEGRRGTTQQAITAVNAEVLDRLEMGRVEERWVKTTDDKDMLVYVIYPPNFDPNKKYPALLYCGGGPQSAVSQYFSYRWNFQIMAAHDYIVVAPNRRGLPTFGQEWNDQISQDYGGQNMKDYFSAIDAVAAEPFVDENRLGAVGASYGGFSVYWLAGNHNGRFKAFIAHCGMFNFESWYGSTEEMFFANWDLGGSYWEKPRPHSYDFSPHNFVGNWDTPILVIHGGRDYRVPKSEGMQAFNAAQLQGIPSRFLFFPEESHFVLKPQNSILWQREFFKWLDQWLK